MNLKKKLKPVAAVTLLQAAGVVFAACYYDNTTTCADLNDLVRQDPNPNGICYDYWYTTQSWIRRDAVLSGGSGPNTYQSYTFYQCYGMAKKFDCAAGAFVGTPQVIIANDPEYLYSQVDHNVPCFQ